MPGHFVGQVRAEHANALPFPAQVTVLFPKACPFLRIVCWSFRFFQTYSRRLRLVRGSSSNPFQMQEGCRPCSLSQDVPSTSGARGVVLTLSQLRTNVQVALPRPHGDSPFPHITHSVHGRRHRVPDGRHGTYGFHSRDVWFGRLLDFWCGSCVPLSWTWMGIWTDAGSERLDLRLSGRAATCARFDELQLARVCGLVKTVLQLQLLQVRTRGSLSSAAKGLEGETRPSEERRGTCTCSRRRGGTARYGDLTGKIPRVPSRIGGYASAMLPPSSTAHETVLFFVPDFPPGLHGVLSRGGSFGIRSGSWVTHPFVTIPPCDGVGSVRPTGHRPVG